jgi:hypothetical protein
MISLLLRELSEIFVELLGVQNLSCRRKLARILQFLFTISVHRFDVCFLHSFNFLGAEIFVEFRVLQGRKEDRHLVEAGNRLLGIHFS